MSLILDALKRAERERPASPPLIAEVPGVAPAPHRRRRPFVLAVVAVAAIGSALFWRSQQKTPAPEPEPEPQERAAAPAEPAPEPPAPLIVPPTPAPLPAPSRTPRRAPPAAPVVIPGTEAVATLDDLTSQESEPSLAPAPEPEAPVAESPAPEEETPAPAAEPEPPPAAEPPTRPVPQALTQPAPLRRFREMPPEYRADFPALNVEVHVYERAPSQRFVMVNGRRYKEGEPLAEGPMLVEIARDGLVLDYRGERLLYTLSR